MNTTDVRHLHRAFELARSARAKGNGPFGAVLTDAQGNVLLEAENTVNTERDVTGHAETNLLKLAYREFDASVLAQCTLYSSAEPCPMCAGAIYWSGVGRVVFGIGIGRLSELMGESSNQAQVPCRQIVTSGNHTVEVIGPTFEDEAARVFEGYILIVDKNN